MNKCNNCIHWIQDLNDSRIGECGNVILSDLDLEHLNVKKVYSESKLITGYEFGCVNYSIQINKK